MSKFRVVGTVFVLAAAGFAIWVAGSGMRFGRDNSAQSAAPDAAFDYLAKDVVVMQMGADGTLQYEISAKQVTQQPNNGQISAQDLVMHRDPPGTEPGGPNRWTMQARQADLPESGDILKLKGDVHAEGRPENSRVPIAVTAEEITYDLKLQKVSSDKPVNVKWGSSTTDAQSLHLNILTGDFNTGAIKVNSANGILAPK